MPEETTMTDDKHKAERTEYRKKRDALTIDNKLRTYAAEESYKAQYAPIFAEYNAKANPIKSECNEKLAPIDAEYKAKSGPVTDEYVEAICRIDYEYKVACTTLNAKYGVLVDELQDLFDEIDDLFSEGGLQVDTVYLESEKENKG